MLKTKTVRELHTAFDLLDKDADGLIHLDELETVLNALGVYPEDEELEVMMSSIVSEQNKDCFDFPEFVTFLQRFVYDEEEGGYETNQGKQMELFSVFANSDGKITRESLKQIMQKAGEVLSEHELEEMFTKLAGENDTIPLEQFAHLFQQQEYVDVPM